MASIDTLRATFFEECEDLLARMGDGLVAMADAVEQTEVEAIHDVFRAVHSIKGGAAAFGLTTLVNFAHAFESVLDLMRAGKMAVGSTTMHTLLRSYDVLCDLVAVARDGGPAPAQTDALLGELDLLADGPDGSSPPDESFDFVPLQIDILGDDGTQDSGQAPGVFEYQIRFQPSGALYTLGHEPAALMRALAELGVAQVQADLSGVVPLAQLDLAHPKLTWRVDLSTTADLSDIENVFEFVEDLVGIHIRKASEGQGHPAPVLAPGASTLPTQVPDLEQKDTILSVTIPSSEAVTSAVGRPNSGAVTHLPLPATIRVNLDRVDRLINQIGELVIMEAMLSQAIDSANLTNDSDITSSLEGIKQLAANIQESVMAIRAQPLKSVFQRMERITREAADATGKQVRLVTIGEGTEVDKTVIERLVDPLTHMIRNSVDHGIEPASVRQAAGKPAEGQITLSAAHRSGRVIIEVSDDGGGINRPKVRELAEQRGLVPAGSALSPAEIDNLLFMPGFSSKEEVSALSGRGVGLDVVRREIQSLGGRVGIQSTPGQGTSFTIALPLTLAVLEGMLIGVGDQTMVLPLSSIIETLRPSASQVHHLGPNGRVIVNRGELIPIVDVAASFGFAQVDQAMCNVLILVECDSGRRAALAVDRIHDQRQVVIKSLEDNFGTVPGISAATILGDGRIALIIDPEEVINTAIPDHLSLSIVSNG